jgi:hypothetical protein
MKIPFEKLATFGAYKNFEEEIISTNNFKFADTLKDIVCLITGCTREQLEDNDFKNQQLSSEWDYWVIGNPTADEYYGHGPQEYSNHFKTEEECAKYLKGEELSINSNYIPCKRSFTYRRLLQEIGTELFRTFVHPDTWVNATMAKTKELDFCFISDVRFPNEVEAVENVGGVVIRVECIDKESVDEHASETALDNWDFKYKIKSKFGLELLFNDVRSMFITINQYS